MAASTTLGGFLLAHALDSPAKGTLAVLLFVVVAGLLYSTGILHRSHVELTRLERRLPQWLIPAKIGVLHDLPWDAGAGIYTDVSFSEWQARLSRALRQRGTPGRVDLVRMGSPLDMYDVVINPYGSTYPEANVERQESLERILAYMRRGGCFVNVADIPGYHLFSSTLKRNIEAASALQTFLDPPLIASLGLRIHNWQIAVGKPGGENWPLVFESGFSSVATPTSPVRVTRVAEVRPGVEAIVKPQRKIHGYDVTPMFFQRFGKGGMVASMFFHGKDFQQNDPIIESLEQIIALVVAEKKFEQR